MKAIFSEYGVPNSVISDSGSQYLSQEFRDFAAKYGFDHTASSPYYHQANGKAERYVNVVKNTLKKALETHKDPSMALLCVRTTPLGSGLPSPAELMFNRKLRSNLPIVNLRAQDEQIKDKLQTRRDKTKTDYDKTTHPLPELHDGQDVRIRNPLTEKWEPGKVISKTSQPRQYTVEKQNGAQYVRNRRHLRCTEETFKPMVESPGNDDDEDKTPSDNITLRAQEEW